MRKTCDIEEVKKKKKGKYSVKDEKTTAKDTKVLLAGE